MDRNLNIPILKELEGPNKEYVKALLIKVSNMDIEKAKDFMKSCKSAWMFLLRNPCRLDDVSTDGLSYTKDSTQNFEIAPSVVLAIMLKWIPGMSLLLMDGQNICHSRPLKGISQFYEENENNVLIVSSDCFYVFQKCHVIFHTLKGTEQDDIVLAILHALFSKDISVFLVSHDKKSIDAANIPDLRGMSEDWQKLGPVISAGIGEISISWDEMLERYSSSQASHHLTSFVKGGASASPPTSTACSPSPSPPPASSACFPPPASSACFPPPASSACFSLIPVSPSACFICNEDGHQSHKCPKKNAQRSTASTPQLSHAFEGHL